MTGSLHLTMLAGSTVRAWQYEGCLTAMETRDAKLPTELLPNQLMNQSACPKANQVDSQSPSQPI